MDKGRLVQVAPPRELYEAPNSRWIAGFVGDINLIEGQVAARQSGHFSIVTQDAGTIIAAHVPSSATSDVCVAIRPEKIRLSLPAQDAAAAVNTFTGVLASAGFLGGVSVYSVKLDRGAVLRVALANATRTAADGLAVGQRVSLSFAPDDVVVLDR
jgi:putrescine transport system ATP-binding protein